MKKYNVSGKKGGDCTDFDSAISLTGEFILLNLGADVR